MPSVVTANLLRTGVVVYLQSDGCWSPELSDAAVAHDQTALKPLEALAQAAVEATEVTAVYAFDVRIAGGRSVPISVRENIRAQHAPTA